MKNTLLPIIAGVIGFASVGALADTQTGNLTVTTTIAASCEAPSPSGNVVAPFDPTRDLDKTAANGGQLGGESITVSISCSGNPTVTKVSFGGGQAFSDELRGMIRSGGTETINYQLLAAAGTGNTAFQLITVTGATRELDLAGEMSFEVAARIYEENPDRSASEVVGGNYSDTVVMTITYS